MKTAEEWVQYWIHSEVKVEDLFREILRDGEKSMRERALSVCRERYDKWDCGDGYSPMKRNAAESCEYGIRALESEVK